MAIVKSTEISAAPDYPTRRHSARERKLLQTSNTFVPGVSADWTSKVGAASAPATLDAALNAVAASASGGIQRVVKATYSFATLGGAQSTISLGVALPDNAIVTQVVTDVLTAPTSAGSTGTIRLNVPTDGNLAPLITADGAASGQLFSDPDSASADVPVKTTAARNLSVTIATENLTAGVLNYFVTYLISD